MKSSMCEGIDNAKEEKPMKLELKIGRRCIACNDGNPQKYRGIFISNDGEGNWVLLDCENFAETFDNAKPDPNATPMNGDEVEFSDNDTLWCTGVYGHYNEANKKHYSMQGVPFDNVRFPQPSKREQLIDLINKKKKHSQDVVFDEEFADEILKITEDE